MDTDDGIRYANINKTDKKLPNEKVLINEVFIEPDKLLDDAGLR